MTLVVHAMLPEPVLCTRMLPAELVMAPPATPVSLIGVASNESLGGATKGTTQSPNSLQSLCTATEEKRGTGAVAEAVITEETGARLMVSWATAGGGKRGSAMNVWNCAVSCTAGLASATS